LRGWLFGVAGGGHDSLVKAADRVKAELGGTDVLVNNADIMLLAPFTEEGHDDRRRMIKANLLGAITVTESSSTSSATAAATSSTCPP
jgi:NAD(P)-dependent dehydrogenase (short-subunit alcohol dehydrogenase family)